MFPINLCINSITVIYHEIQVELRGERQMRKES